MFFTTTVKNIFYVLAFLGILVGGAFIDSTSRIQRIQNMINTLVVLCSVVIYYAQKWYTITLAALIFLACIHMIVSLKIFIGQTSLLNRGRYASLLVFVLSIFGIPFIFYAKFYEIYLILMIFFWLFIFFWERKYPLPREDYSVESKIRNDLAGIKNPDPELEKTLEPYQRYKSSVARIKAYFSTKRWSEIFSHLRKMLKELFTNIMRSKYIPYLLIFFGMSVMIGFNLSIIDTYNLSVIEYIIVSFFFVVSLVVFGILMDYVGRKPLAIIAISILGVHALFYGFPGFQWPGFISFLFYLIIISITLILVIGVIGDTSDFISRGRIIGVTLFVILIGLVIGFQVDYVLDIRENLDQSELRYGLSVIMSLIAFIAMIVMHLIPESFQRESIKWKEYLDRFVILDKSGVNLFYYNFQSDLVGQSNNDINRDLVSGGLTGIEMMIKEISQSDHNLDVLEQSDKKIIFVHGKFCVIVLFTTNYLWIHKQKLQKFLEEFEYINYDVIKQFSGMVSDLVDIDRLCWKYFRVHVHGVDHTDEDHTDETNKIDQSDELE
jgi:hypothetical protein